jgi:hypothetical protein
MNTVCPSQVGDTTTTNIEGPVSTSATMRVLGILLATFFIGVVDLVLSQESASSEAIKSFTNYLDACDNTIRRWFSDSFIAHEGVRKSFQFLQRDAPSQLDFVDARAAEAVMEPSYWHKRPWNQLQFLNFEALGQRLRMDLLTMEWALMGIKVSNAVALELNMEKREEISTLIKKEKEAHDELLRLMESSQQFGPLKRRIVESFKDLLHQIRISMNSDCEEQIEKVCKENYLKRNCPHLKMHEQVTSEFEKFTADLSRVVPSFDFEKQLGKHGEVRFHTVLLMLEVTQQFILKDQYRSYVDC